MNKIFISKLFTHNLNMVKKILGNHTTTKGGDLDNFSRKYLPNQYRGIYMANERLPVLPEDSFIIINRPMNQHWISAFNKNGKLYEFDSFARKNFIGSGGDKYIDFNTKHDSIPDQNGLDTDCGQRVLATMLSVFGKKL